LSRKNLRLGLVLAGYVPFPQRNLIRLLGKRTFAAYRNKLYGSPA